MDTLVFGVLTFLVVLGPLVILHELGHYYTAKRLGVKVLEFGFGFPPRAFGLWTGRTRIRLDSATRFDFGDGMDTVRPGDIVTIRALEEDDGAITAVSVRPQRVEDLEERKEGNSLFVGKVREVLADEIVLSDMLWSFNWLPLGGFVRMLGEEDPSAKGSLASKSARARIGVIGAGAFVNALIPFVLLPLVAMLPQPRTVGDVVVSSVFPGSPADEAGIRAGDKIVKVDGREIRDLADLQNGVTLRLGASSTWEMEKGLPDPFPRAGQTWQYQYSGDIESVSLVPRWKPPRRTVVEETSDPSTEMALSQARVYDPSVGLNDRLAVVSEVTDSLTQISLEDARRIDPAYVQGDVLRAVPIAEEFGEIGITTARTFDTRLGIRTHIQEGATGVQITTINQHNVTLTKTPWAAVWAGWQQAYDMIVLTRNAITGMVVGSTNPQFDGPATVGPIGIGQLTGEVAVADASLSAKVLTLAALAATLSFSLAVINILPIPALDGGRIFFVVIELVRGGKKVPPEREGLIHLVGFAILLALIALVSVQDIMRIFRGESFF